MTQPKASETRAFIRYPVAISAEVLHGGRIITAATRDVSAGGVGLVTREALPEGSQVALTLFLTEDGIENPDLEPLEVKGSIVWCAEQQEGGHIAGARFGTLSRGQQARLQRFLVDLDGNASGTHRKVEDAPKP